MLYAYKLYNADGSEAGEAHCAVPVKPSETILTGAARKYRVLEVFADRGRGKPVRRATRELSRVDGGVLEPTLA